MTIVMLHVIATALMAGICWFVQWVHYPLFRHVALTDFPAFQRENFRTGWITIPLMSIELVTGLLMLYDTPSLWLLINVGLMALIGISTLLFQVPAHLNLVHEPSRKNIDFLIRTNYIRTISWTLRIVVLTVVLG